ncbi:unnamed protein product [Symbiodinium natans]|uniref:Uncharacterized protein n=1 Tax=Symbiodinium natans TaxID=878477 RepID=A0A812UQY7_9DINO|nr:unnamed protein product [Symbiodinium natans]
MDLQSLRDHCLIIVGSGGETDELLARRRIAAGGRLVHVLTRGVDDERVSIFATDRLSSCFFWLPPQAETSSFGKRLGPSFRTYWSKTGPDAVRLGERQTLQIYMQYGPEEHSQHIRILDQEDSAVVEISGHVVLNPDMKVAQELCVDVANLELKACGTFTWRYVLLSMTLLFVWHVIRWAASMEFEQRAHLGQYPWWRGAFVLVNGLIFCVEGLFQSWADSLAGERPTRLTNMTGVLLCVVLVLCSTGLQLADYPQSLVGLSGLFIAGPTLLYYLTRARHTKRQFVPCMLWTSAQLLNTVGNSMCQASVVVMYMMLLANGQGWAATMFMPVATATVEAGGVLGTKLMYERLVLTKRPAVPGDIARVAMPYMLISAHVFAEGARLISLFSGAVASGQFSWIQSAALTLGMNLCTRLGWTKYLAFRGLNLFCPRLAAALLPTGWDKLHDEVKVYGGYFRFIVVLSLAVARAIIYGDMVLEGPKAPAFNASAACALVTTLVLEMVEDEVVVKELLPMSPITTEMLEADVLRNNANPGRLISVERRLDMVHVNGVWRTAEVNERGNRSASSLDAVFPKKAPEEMIGHCHSMGPEETTGCHSLGSRRTSLRSRFRRVLGQERAVIPALTLHGLREMPFMVQLAAVGVSCEVILSFVNATLNPSFVRGFCEVSPDFRPVVMVWWPVPLEC